MSEQRDNILARACELYLTHGFEGVSMRKLAREVGVTAPALYRHFSSKEDLLLSVVGQAFDRFSQYLYRALRGPTPQERYRLAGEAYLDFALENPRLYEALYTTPDALGVDAFPPELGQLACATGQFWHDRVREMMDAGYLKEGDPQDVSRTMWGHAHGLMSVYLRGMLLMSEDEFRRFFTESGRRVMEGVGTEKLAHYYESVAERRAQALTA